MLGGIIPVSRWHALGGLGSPPHAEAWGLFSGVWAQIDVIYISSGRLRVARSAARVVIGV